MRNALKSNTTEQKVVIIIISIFASAISFLSTMVSMEVSVFAEPNGDSDDDHNFQTNQMNKCNSNIGCTSICSSSVAAPNDSLASTSAVTAAAETHVVCNTNADILNTDDD
jgi:hypothetical protein